MEYLIIGVVVAAALACPVFMCGPMILRRVGLMQAADNDMSCMGMMSEPRPRDLAQLVSRRNELDDEIASVEASLQARLLLPHRTAARRREGRRPRRRQAGTGVHAA